MDTDLDTLTTALYVMVDDLLRAHPEQVHARPKGSFEPRAADAAGLLTLAVMQAVWAIPAKHAICATPTGTSVGCSRTCPCSRVTTNRLLKLAATMVWLIGQLARQTSIVTDDVWVADSTLVERPGSDGRPGRLRSETASLAGTKTVRFAQLRLGSNGSNTAH